MNIKDLKNNANHVVICGKLAKRYFNIDNQEKKYSKIIIENSKRVKNKIIITSIKCYLYNKPYKQISSDEIRLNDYVKVIGELQNRDNNTIIFVHKINKI